MRDAIEKYLAENATLTISDDHMMAYLSLSPWPSWMEQPTPREVTSWLEEQSIVMGINKLNIQCMLDEKIFYQNVMVAKGIETVDGENGWFEYLIDISEKDTKPKILADGSVDYSSIGKLEVREAGTEIVKYHPATQGTNGVTVYGEERKARHGKQLPKMVGEGYKVQDDGVTYITTIRGRVFMRDGRLVVSRLYEVFGDVDNTTGNIDFNGDVIVYGNVISGMQIRVSGDLTIEGHVEGSELVAAGNIILKTGMQGGGKGIACAGGNIESKFFEQVKISAGGIVKANSLLNCMVDAGDSVIVTGRFGVIIGGYIRALNMVSATMYSNTANVRTEIAVGVNPDMTVKAGKLDQKIEVLEKEIQKLDQAVYQLDIFLKKQMNKEVQSKMAASQESKEKQDEMNAVRSRINKDMLNKKIAVNRMLKEKQEELEPIKEKRRILMERLEKSVHSKIVVDKMMHEGTILHINGANKSIRGEATYNVTWKVVDDDMVMVSN